jgi:putative ABC transport system ATP-binding protein
MIRLESVHKYFSKGTAAEVHALRGLDLELQEGSFTVLIGANGSGKSTLLQVLAGSERPEAGRVCIDGLDITQTGEHIRSRWMSRVFQNPLTGSCPNLTVLENFRLAALRSQVKGLRIGTGASFRKRIAEKVAQTGMGLEHKLDQLMGTLSGGQRQALTLLMAVTDDSRLLLMDEPTAALDPRTATAIMELADHIIRESGLTAVMVTHNLRDALRYGQRLILMSEGKIVRDVSGSGKINLTLTDIASWYD